jgi:hypothetical protein
MLYLGMARYTLKTFSNTKLIERFDHRATDKLRTILLHPRHHRDGETGPFGEDMEHPNRFEIYDSQMERVFQGNVDDALAFTKTLSR